ncbi:MAG TPA: transglutaminase family protein [Allosphingosinicella sp.]|jgi:regulator of sirC expression with transglutaminase-like and TPR domain
MSQAAAIAAQVQTAAEAGPSATPSPVDRVREVLSWPEERLDYAEAKLALDRAVDASIDSAATIAKLNKLAEAALALAGLGATSDARLKALRTVVYESGPWNDYRPCAYDHSNIRGRNVRVKLISHYLETRLGDCVSMPVLFLILADKLGLDVALAASPLHLFVRYRAENSQVINLETTSGALPARDVWIRQARPFSDRALANRIYMRTLSRREGVAAMAGVVLQHLNDRRRDEEAIAVTELMLQQNPRDVHALANQGNAYGRLVQAEFLDKYPSKLLPSLLAAALPAAPGGQPRHLCEGRGAGMGTLRLISHERQEPC